MSKIKDSGIEQQQKAMSKAEERTLEFKKKATTEVITLDELKLTQSIMDPDIPEHYEFFNDILKLCEEKGIKTEIGEILINNGGISKFPGAAKIKRLEDQYGENNIQSYLIRRALTVISFTDYAKSDMTYGIALNYIQNGVQLALGNSVHACDNLCIYGENLIGTYGHGRGNNLGYNKVLEHVEGWLGSIKKKVKQDNDIIKKLKSVIFNHESTNEFFGRLTRRAMENKVLKDINAPLAEQQVKDFQRLYLERIDYGRNDEAYHRVPSLWDFLNIGTEVLSLKHTDPFQVLVANNNLNEYVMEEYLTEENLIVPEFALLDK